MSEEPPKLPTPPTPEIRRSKDFLTLYANQAIFETSAWDLKIILGILDQRFGKIAVDQVAEIMIPWPLAKVMLYWLELQVTGYELENGKIQVSASAIPPAWIIPENLKDNPVVQKFHEYAVKLRQEFIDSLPPKP